MGLPRQTLPVVVDYPIEGHEDGCPGAWYRSDFAASVAPYERHMTESGFASNPRLDRCDDVLVIEAVHYLEQQHLRRRAADSAVLNGSK